MFYSHVDYCVCHIILQMYLERRDCIKFYFDYLTM